MKGNRDGFTLVEVLVSVMLLAVILTMLGGLTFSTARQAVTNGNASERQAISLEAVNRASTLPWNLLTVGTTCDTVNMSGNRYESCRAISTVGSARDIVITTTPLRSRVAPSVVRFTRASPVTPQNPLCTLGGC
jgi:prepilin-type N-terminal cleavage/methylation domain-containing protein